MTNPTLPPEEPSLTHRSHWVNSLLLWSMRVGIVVMLIVTGVYVARWNQLTDEQEEMVRYVEVNIPAVEYHEAPILSQIDLLLRDKTQRPEAARKQLSDELMPALVRLRKVADGPVAAAKTPAVKQLAEEYRQSVEELINVCRTTIRVIDDPKLGEKEGYSQVLEALRRAVGKNRAWREHVAETTARLKLKGVKGRATAK
ncbi:MAG TPA: hypothetical protein PKE31_06440 [Pseudomonadota bacterium]|nr:hypothetical protein [Pseudomonadota bacterium]